MTRLFGALICACTLFAQTALAADTVSFSFAGCTDSRDKPVASQADPALAVLVETRLVEGNRVIFYNPSRLPQLLPETRAFLYAHECAWTRLGMPIDLDRSVENARRADCWAVDTLTRSKLIKAGALEAIEMDLAMASTDSASQLPSPSRELKLAACAGGKVLSSPASRSKGTVLEMGSATASPAWNACVLGCGNKLFACGRGSSCQSSFDQCKAGCNGK
ncbi:hypothetical protein Q9Q94_06085 [Uliginosibacterium sp. 31-16]|uniref:hypothetical protein n=1 Tax=Uliginosibacterium sp. 31-16 TaxID=3068315 RepID=UPI0027400D8D|nr:hypothetical protein [Uliginosibacterium sp. 31-16]MDP5239091.1 hypothetical protein [Uliginosibacterium sp. 31-16]